MKSFFTALTIVLLLFSCSTSDDSDNTSQNTNSGTDMNSNGGSDDNEDNEDDTNATYQGTFVSVAHPTSGLVKADSQVGTLTFTDFMTDAGPLLEVYVATDENAANYISLGELQGTSGNHAYTLPNNVNFESHKYVIIWCVDFSVSFGYAILEMQ